ncbi:uncharacterized protein LOC126904739 [Daktulosphaira vitifoliae]|uniref:uncharacterized protein LOC126904739 n=1 Tax=Daktulosphaira vitifoliae TaxID=58002 RepID=UPI0021AA01FC|nr:uncharacterized protein LOC126904739 [Daktulosphaira vitifoliae]
MFAINNFIKLVICYILLDYTIGEPQINGINKCHKNDPELDQCLLNILKQLKTQIIQGNPAKHLPSLDPLQINQIEIHRVIQDIIIKGNLSNLDARGISSIIVKLLKLNLKEKTLEAIVNIPLINFTTNFKLNTIQNALNVHTLETGRCEGILYNATVFLHGNTEITKDKVQLIHINIDLKFGDIDLRMLEPLISSSLASNVLNSNKRLVLNLVTPIAEDVLKEQLLLHGNHILSNIKFFDVINS